MTRSSALAIVACLAAIACDEDPARSVKIVARPPATAGSVETPPSVVGPSRTAEWRPEACPPPPEDSPGPSSLTVTGPCAFQHRGAVSCEPIADDFYISMSRKAARGATLMVYINVEKYHGPGSYDGAQMFVGVQDKTSIYRWSSDTIAITVGPGEEFAVLPTTRLDAEPVLIDCTGPMTNFQCGGRGDAPAFESTTEVVSGTLRCEGGGKEKK